MPDETPKPNEATDSTETEIYALEPESEENGDVESAVESADPDREAKLELAAQAERVAELRAPFRRGIGGKQTALVVAGVLLLIALVMAGVRAGDTDLTTLMLKLANTLLAVAVNGAIGTLAVLLAARMAGAKDISIELFALRMVAAAAAFEMMYQIGTPIPGPIDDWILGAAAYATIVWLLFRLPPKETGMVIAWHAGLMTLLWIYGWSNRAIADRPAPTPVVEPMDPGLG